MFVAGAAMMHAVVDMVDAMTDSPRMDYHHLSLSEYT
jgi:hypothetical protein